MAKKKSTAPITTLINLGVIGKVDKQQKFKHEHALKLLRLSNSQWELKDERYTFKDNEIRRNTSDSSNKGTEK